MTNPITSLLNTSISSEFDTLIEKHMPDTFPALSICVIYRGEPVLRQAWGWLEPGKQQFPVSPDSLFDLASVTKLFIETTFLTLVNAGKIGLDDKLVQVIPEFGRINPRPIGGGQDPHTRQNLPIDEQFQGQSVNPTRVTFKHLLTHTSGLPAWRDVFNQASNIPPIPPRTDSSPEPERWNKALRSMVEYPFVGTIGDTVRYSDIGIMLLGEAVSRIHGKSLDLAVYEQVCEPLQLNSVTYNPVQQGIPIIKIIPTELDSLWRKRRAWGEVHDENACGVGGIAGHAGLFATANDIANFGQAWLSGDENLHISDDLRHEATRQHASGQFRLGLGWMLKAQENSSAGDLFSMSSYGHTGFTGTSLWIDPEQQVVSAVLTNRVYHGRDPDGIHAFRYALHNLIAQGIKSL